DGHRASAAWCMSRSIPATGIPTQSELLDCILSAASENGRHQFLLQLMHLPALGRRRIIEPCQMEQPM
ncbi:MAG TPA: hypothetical protein VJ278_05785, partial [Chthoniobacterales bacterium]|nr:hypothetical protein [Chthoniobacterales bacterium]